MRLKSKYDGRPAGFISPTDQSLDDARMTPMHTIEVADGDSPAAQVFRQ